MEIERVTIITDEVVDAFARLMPQLAPGTELPDRAALTGITASGAGDIFVAREAPGAEILGVLTLVVFRIPTGVRARIEDVVVDAACRGRGAASALIAAAMDRAGEKGANAVTLNSGPARAAANRLYQRLGFQRVETNVYRLYLKDR
jgi:ribosomal protein S18 acetylase RimI-like enzyme